MMINSPVEAAEHDVERIAAAAPRGALALAGVATLIVVVLWFAFYLLVFVARTATP
jgi:hypothetical protein